MLSYFQNVLSTCSQGGFPPNDVFMGEFGMWLGTGSDLGLTNVNFTPQDRIQYYTDYLNAARDAGIQNLSFHTMFSEVGLTPNYGIVKDPDSGSGYWDDTLASVIRTAYP
jgi:hypothetical protein